MYASIRLFRFHRRNRIESTCSQLDPVHLIATDQMNDHVFYQAMTVFLGYRSQPVRRPLTSSVRLSESVERTATTLRIVPAPLVRFSLFCVTFDRLMKSEYIRKQHLENFGFLNPFFKDRH